MCLKFFSKLIALIFFTFLPLLSYTQCTGGTSSGTIAPRIAWQTRTVIGGQYYSFSASQGTKYTFTFCQNGGSTSWDTQITILDNSGATVAGAYSDDAAGCGTGSHYVFTAPTTATYRILITEYNCNSNSTNATLAYSATINDNPCNAVQFLNPTCGTSYSLYSTSGATNTTTPGNPGCATYNGGDVWFKTVAPFSGSLVISTQAGNITDGGLAAYKASNCSASFTSLGCNDNTIGLMPQLSLNSLTPGDSIYIRFWAKNNAQSGTFGIYVNDPNPTYCYTGSSVQNFTSGCIRITPNLQSQSGNVWNKVKIDLSSSFNYYFDVNLGNDDNGADGLCFALQNSSAGMSALGSVGWNLGMGGIPNSVAIEFDTFFNGTGVNDISEDHTAISLNGNMGTPVAGPVQASSTSTNIEDGLNHRVTIDWNAASKRLRVYFDGNLRLTYINDLVANVFGGNPLVYWGFSGSTGAYTNTQTICPGSLPGNPLPVTWAFFNAIHNGSDVVLAWATKEEINTKEFIIERSADGYTFLPIGSVKATGNSTQTLHYKYTDTEVLLTNEAYYRIKEIDIDGNQSYSPIKHILTEASDTYFSLSPNPVSMGQEFTVSYFNKATISDAIIIYDQYGREVYKGFIVNGIQKIKIPENITAGLFHVIIVTETGTLNEKLFIASN